MYIFPTNISYLLALKRLDPSSNIVRVLIDMYVEIGDNIALQYGGSEAHKKVTADRSEVSNITGPIGKVCATLTFLRVAFSSISLTPLFFTAFFSTKSCSLPLGGTIATLSLTG